MSFLSILLVASAFYFAHARPDSQPFPDSYGTDQIDDSNPEDQHPPAVPDESSVPMNEPAEYQQNLHDFMRDLSETAEKYMMPMMSKIEKEKKEELMDMGMNGFASYINYWLLIIQQIQYEKDKSSNDPPNDGSLPRDEMIMLDPHSFPETEYIPETEHGEEEVLEA